MTDYRRVYDKIMSSMSERGHSADSLRKMYSDLFDAFHKSPRGKQDKEYDSYLGLGELLWQLYKAKRKERYEYCDEL